MAQTADTSGAAYERVLSRAELLAAGVRPKQFTRAVRAGQLIRLRRDHYVRSSASDGSDVAVRVGGRLTCVSSLATAGAFVLSDDRTHIHIARESSRLRSPRERRRPWSAADTADARLHWGRLIDAPPSRHAVSLVDAVLTLVRCRPPRAVVATLDSLLFLGIMTFAELQDAFALLPRRYDILLRLVDARAESGPETLMRLMLRQLGLEFDVQVDLPGVGRVDFVVAGRLVVECDSKRFHEGWVKQQRDRRRDLAAARLGYATLRPLAGDIMYRPETVAPAIQGIVRAMGR